MATAQTATGTGRRELPYERQAPLVMNQIDLTNKLHLLIEEVKHLKSTVRERRISNLESQSSTITGDQLHNSILIVPNNTKEKSSYLLPLHKEIFNSRIERSFDVDIRNDSLFEVEIKSNGSTANINGSSLIDAQSGSRWYLTVKGGQYTLTRLT